MCYPTTTTPKVNAFPMNTKYVYITYAPVYQTQSLNSNSCEWYIVLNRIYLITITEYVCYLHTDRSETCQKLNGIMTFTLIHLKLGNFKKKITLSISVICTADWCWYIALFLAMLVMLGTEMVMCVVHLSPDVIPIQHHPIQQMRMKGMF